MRECVSAPQGQSSVNRWAERAFGKSPKRQAFDYLIAGNDAALILPQEQAEDNPLAGQNDLASWESANDISRDVPVVVIGISCGLSATYVASMLDAALSPSRPCYTAVALGFNPVDAVRQVKVDGWAGSFYATLQALENAGGLRGIIVNPIAGPETIAGSSSEHLFSAIPRSAIIVDKFIQSLLRRFSPLQE
jgi:hypothetical protein